jgi:hypothetical protein
MILYLSLRGSGLHRRRRPTDPVVAPNVCSPPNLQRQIPPFATSCSGGCCYERQHPLLLETGPLLRAVAEFATGGGGVCYYGRRSFLPAATAVATGSYGVCYRQQRLLLLPVAEFVIGGGHCYWRWEFATGGGSHCYSRRRSLILAAVVLLQVRLAMLSKAGGDATED